MSKLIEHWNKDNTCPKCKSSWDGGSMLETFLKQRDAGVNWLKGLTDEKVEAKMKENYSPPYRWGREIGIEIQGSYDGISYIQCPDCKTEFSRFTGEESAGSYTEESINLIRSNYETIN